MHRKVNGTKSESFLYHFFHLQRNILFTHDFSDEQFNISLYVLHSSRAKIMFQSKKIKNIKYKIYRYLN